MHASSDSPVWRVASAARRFTASSMSVALLAAACVGCDASTEGTAASTHGTAASTTRATALAGPPCAAAAAKTLARTVGVAAKGIYLRELSSTGVREDQNQVERNVPLLSALASGNRAAVQGAVTSLVFSGTHIVRLRVSQGGRVLADVGGPYILAPVAGSLRFRGRSVGRYLLSVQDDLGYVKLESRFIGVPLVLDQGSRRIPLEGTLSPEPPVLPEHGAVTYRGSSYESFAFKVKAFPTGSLRITLLVPLPHAFSTASCAQIRVSELGRIAHLIWRRFALVKAPLSAYILLARRLTGALSYIRSGSRELAGSSRPGPSRLPIEGAIHYHGAIYGVSSFPATVGGVQVRVYELVPVTP